MTEPRDPERLAALDRDGFVLLRGLIPGDAARRLADLIDAALQQVAEPATALRNSAGVYGARNVLDWLPQAREVWRTAPLLDFLTSVLGDDACLVRVLFFDKPPGRSWSLPWHRDETIAVADNRLPSQRFTRPTIKAGVPHVVAPSALLERMLTLRLHLDEVTEENGPLDVSPGSHRTTDAAPSVTAPVRIFAQAGDVLAMRPLLLHGSSSSLPGTTRRRRILHLEFAADRELSDGYRWREMEPARREVGLPAVKQCF